MRATIADLPFPETRLAELLHLDDDREEHRHDDTRVGWSRVQSLWLESAVGEPFLVAHALVLSLHIADEQQPADDIILAFELPDGQITMRASKFLEVWLPMLPRAPSTVVALCNPDGATLVRPITAEGALWYGVGDVASWLEDGERVILAADAWRRL